MTFGQAVEALNTGKKVAREGWNGKGMWLELYAPDHLFTSKIDGQYFPIQEHILMKTAQGNVVPWLASQTDVLAQDWAEVSAN